MTDAYEIMDLAQECLNGSLCGTDLEKPEIRVKFVKGFIDKQLNFNEGIFNELEQNNYHTANKILDEIHHTRRGRNGRKN